jgi:IS5 family transposase
MKLFNDITLRFENPIWEHYPELAVMDSLLEAHPELVNLIKDDVTKGHRNHRLGRKDSPSVEQIMRAAIYKEIKRIEYRQLEMDLYDSTVCREFIKLDGRKPFSFEVLHKYISIIRKESLGKLMHAINRLLIGEGIEDVQKVRIDSTVVEAPIHYPTNNALVWDCFKEFYRIVAKLKRDSRNRKIKNHKKQAKKNYYKINNTKSKDQQQELFRTQLKLFRRIMSMAATICRDIDLEDAFNENIPVAVKLRAFLPTMEKVYSQSYRRQILGEAVSNHEKLFSIYEQHTDIIVKGQREVQFGHKVNLVAGKSNLILDCVIEDGNPKDTSLYKGSLERIQKTYGITPRDVSTDGGYASLENSRVAQTMGIRNIVFNKIVGSLRNITTSKNMETRLKKWRSGIEAVISNLKRRFDIFRCEWKSREHFDAKVMWSVIAYNLRVAAAWYLSAI